MMKIKNVFKHFGKICTHKYWVFHYCNKLGIPMQGIVHDLSKFSPTEFWESVKYYSGTSSPIDASKKANGYSNAWLHHKGRNKHHYEYWQDNFDKGGQALLIPYNYTVEMLCDYLGAGRAYNGKNFTYEKEYAWWVNKKSKGIAMHPVQIRFFDVVMMYLNEEKTLPAETQLKITYDLCYRTYQDTSEITIEDTLGIYDVMHDYY